MTCKTDVVIIGAGQAGLAMSHFLNGLGIDHVLLDRGAVGQRWRAERWASLHLLTPNWMTRLPGWQYRGNDPDGFMHKDEVVGMLNRYARSFGAPVQEFTSVESVRRAGTGFRVRTNRNTWSARAVVVATGACDTPAVPGFATGIDAGIAQVTTTSYLHPDQLADGGVLVVGGSATGVQLAEEIQRSGRQVTLAVGAHVRLPRRYRGRDVLDWLDRCGVLSETRDPNVPHHKALAQPSLQLVGSAPSRSIDLGSLSALGVTCTGRVAGIQGTSVRFEESLTADVHAAEARRQRTLARIDDFIADGCIPAPAAEPEDGVFVPGGADMRDLDLRHSGIRTILWATGFRRRYPWLDVPVLNASGEVIQSYGLTPCPGLYTLGLPFMRRRNSTFIDGVGRDAAEISTCVAQYLGRIAQAAA